MERHIGKYGRKQRYSDDRLHLFPLFRRQDLAATPIVVSVLLVVSADITFHKASVDNTGEMRIDISGSTADRTSLLSLIDDSSRGDLVRLLPAIS